MFNEHSLRGPSPLCAACQGVDHHSLSENTACTGQAPCVPHVKELFTTR